MEAELRKAGLRAPLPSSKWAEIARLYALYTDLTGHEAWVDFISRIEQMRHTTIQQLLHGTLDKFGNEHDDERRAVLTSLETILSFVPALLKQFDELRDKQTDIEKRASEHGLQVRMDLEHGWASSSPRHRSQPF